MPAWRNGRIFSANQKYMYGLKCSYYTEQFSTIDGLINDVMISGMDPNYEITFNGEVTGEILADLLEI